MVPQKQMVFVVIVALCLTSMGVLSTDKLRVDPAIPVSMVDGLEDGSGGEEQGGFAFAIRHDFLVDHGRNASFQVPGGLDEAWLTMGFYPHDGAPGCVANQPTIQVETAEGVRYELAAPVLVATFGSSTCDSMMQERIRPPPGLLQVSFQGKGAVVGLVSLEEIA